MNALDMHAWHAGGGARAAVVVQDHLRPVRDRPPVSRWPAVKVIAHSLELSLRFLASAQRGTSSIALGDRLLEDYWRRIFRAGNAALVVEGREHFDGRAAIIMSNHTSLLDIPAMLGAVPGSLRMVMKAELGRVPIWGHAAIAAGFVPIDRHHHNQAVRQLDVAKELLRKGVHIWIAPEGTRSRGRGLQAFKRGGFHLAAQLQAPIVPAWIEGTEAIVRADSFRVVQDGVVVVRFGPCIETVDASIDALMEQTRLAIAALGDEARTFGA